MPLYNATRSTSYCIREHILYGNTFYSIREHLLYYAQRCSLISQRPSPSREGEEEGRMVYLKEEEEEEEEEEEGLWRRRRRKVYSELTQ